MWKPDLLVSLCRLIYVALWKHSNPNKEISHGLRVSGATRPFLRKSLDWWFDRVEYVPERAIVRESGWSGRRVVSEGMRGHMDRRERKDG